VDLPFNSLQDLPLRSVVGRALHSSYWPTLLGADTSASNGVTTSVKYVNFLKPLTLGCVAVAAVVTPLGLYDAIVPGSTTPIAFKYAQDISPLGYGTPPRSSLGFSRLCGGYFPVVCPSSDVRAIITSNDSTSDLDVATALAVFK
jgi:hypothetical protein